MITIQIPFGNKWSKFPINDDKIYWEWLWIHDDGDDNDGINGIISGSVTATLWKVTYYDSFELKSGFVENADFYNYSQFLLHINICKISLICTLKIS